LCRLLDNMEKCCTDGNIIRRIRFSCLITKDTNTHTEYAMLTVFAWQQRLYERAWMLRYTYECLVHCLSCSFNFFIPALIHFASFDVLTVIMKVKGFSEVTLFGGGQSTDIYFKLRRILRTGLVSHPRDDNLFHFIHIPLFVLCFDISLLYNCVMLSVILKCSILSRILYMGLHLWNYEDLL